MLTWNVNDFTKDLKLKNPEEFNKEKFRDLLKRFNHSDHIAKDLLSCLQDIGDRPEYAIFYYRNKGNLRGGYIGLNRWCLTEGTKFQKGVGPAIDLWKFLFNELSPTKLADSPATKAGTPVIDERTLFEWHKRISGE